MSGVRKGEDKSMAAAQRGCNKRESKDEGDLTMAETGELVGLEAELRCSCGSGGTRWRRR
jgi:hypothetical protein